MQVRKKLALVAAAALPLTGIAVFGGIQAANAGGGPLLECPNLSGTLTFNNGATGEYLNAGSGGTGELAVGAAAGATTIDVANGKGSTASALEDQTLTIAGATYTATAESTTPSGETYNQITITPGLAAAEKAKTAVTVNPTTTTAYTVAYNATGVSEDLTATATGCGSTADYPGEFAPNTISLTGTTPDEPNEAKSLEATPAPFTISVGFPSISSDWTQPTAETLTFPGGKDDSLDLLTFQILEKAGVVASGEDYATTKAGELNLNALVSFTVCTEGELDAINGVDTLANGDPNEDAAVHGGPISPGASPLAVCDGGTSPAYPEANGLDEVLASETSDTATNGYDGTPLVAIWGISVLNGSTTGVII